MSSSANSAAVTCMEQRRAALEERSTAVGSTVGGAGQGDRRHGDDRVHTGRERAGKREQICEATGKLDFSHLN